jgi:hypothetical protein
MIDTLPAKTNGFADESRDQADHPLVGTWQTISTSDAIENGATTTQPIAGCVIFTPSRLAVLYGNSDAADHPADSGYKLANNGTRTENGETFDVAIDFSTSEFISRQFTRHFDIDGPKLTLKTPLHESKASPGVMKVSYLVASKSQ